MKKFFKWILLFLGIILTVNTAFAENFYIENYKVDMNVHKDKTVDVEENIDVFFTTPSHGIFRRIPLKRREAIISYSASNLHSVSNNKDYLYLKLGNPNRTVSGAEHYTIKYTHKLAGETNEFYYNIIGNDWDTEIKKVTFMVNMPKEFDSSQAGLSIGSKGTEGFNGGAVFTTSNKQISGQTTSRILNPHDGITLRVTLPEGYFDVQPDYVPIIMLGLMILCTLISFGLWYFVGRDDHVTPVVNFYPPQGYNSAEVEVLYSGKSTQKGLVSLIIWFANKGYLDIKMRDEKHFSINKRKAYENDGQNKWTYEFYDALIGKLSSITDKVLETSPKFYTRCQECIEGFNKLRERIFERNSISWHNKLIMIFCITGILISEIYFLGGFSFDIITEYGVLLLFPIIAFSVAIMAVKQSSIFLGIWSIGFGGIPTLLLCYGFANNITETTLPYILTGFVCIIISTICFYHLPKRNSYGNRIYGEILGFKKFLETVELSRVQSLVEQDPKYCFSVLPYLYVFGLSDKWINKFEKYFKEPPEWYSGRDFGRNFGHIMSRSAALTVPSTANGGVSSSSSSSSGGGGCSGGGSGGGGGGSW